MRCPDIAMPDRIAVLPTDPRGFPIFFSITQPDGSYSFEGISLHRLLLCAKDRLCGICGQKLGYWVSFVGGPKSITNRVFTDPPMHRECAEYAFAVCPFLLRSGWDRTRRKDVLSRRDDVIVPSAEADFNKPERMGMLITREYRLYAVDHDALVFRTAPAKEVVWMSGGDGE